MKIEGQVDASSRSVANASVGVVSTNRSLSSTARDVGAFSVGESVRRRGPRRRRAPDGDAGADQALTDAHAALVTAHTSTRAAARLTGMARSTAHRRPGVDVRALGDLGQSPCAFPMMSNAASVRAIFRLASSNCRRSRAISVCSPLGPADVLAGFLALDQADVTGPAPPRP
ncbi:hypothetical protein OG559_30595 [Micromonospora sp. NBC_01405]|uniref:hypothetical protein n=1 Tax=Micromonospora sp. NBC_01405 TaxID=2903589 RepID=UPI00325582AA